MKSIVFFNTIRVLILFCVTFLFVTDASAITNTQSGNFESSSSQYLSITDANQTGLDITGNMTLEAWIKLESQPSSGQEYGIIAKFTGVGNQRSYRLHYYNGSGVYKLYFQISSTGANNTELIVNKTLNVGQWYHVAATYNAAGGSATMYLDGDVIGSTSGLYTSVFNSTSSFFIGSAADGTSMYFDGLIDEARVWNAVRTSTEINDNMYETLTGSESNLVGYWELNSTTTDKTPNNNDLTNNNSTSYSEEVGHHISCSGIVNIDFVCTPLGLF